MKTIGVLTSGGDAPGMNACIAAIAGRAERLGLQVRGIPAGFRGLARHNVIPLGTEIMGLARRGGTFLGTSRNGGLEAELSDSGPEKLLSACGIDALVVLGGGGSLAACARLAQEGLPVVGVPCTIDNDVSETDCTIGFDAAVNKGIRAADEIMDTAESLSERVFVLETLGGNTGHIAVAVAYAAGADAVFVHEMPPDINAAAEKIRLRMDAGRKHGLVVVCEDLGTAELAEKLESAVGRRVRVTALGHAQRGGSPTYLDRFLARAFGEAAADAAANGTTGTMTAWRANRLELVPLAATCDGAKPIDLGKYNLVNGL